MSFRNWLVRLLLIFLAYLILFPAWLWIQPVYCRALVGVTGIWLRISEFPRITEKLEFDGDTVRIYGVRQKEPYGEWKEIQFPFYLPFLLLLIFMVPGPTLRQRGYLAAGVLSLVLAVHLVLITVVVKQTHIHFYRLKGITIAGPATVFLLDWIKRILFDFGKQAVTGGLLLYILLRFQVGRRNAASRPNHAEGDPHRNRWGWKPIAVFLGTAVVAGGLLSAVRKPIQRSWPWYEGFHLDLGKASLLEGRYETAVAAFREAVRVNPSGAANHYHLGVALGRLELWEEARESFRQSLSGDPDNPMAHRDLGLTLIRLNRSCEALPHLRRAADFPDLPGGDVPPSLIGRIAAECGLESLRTIPTHPFGSP